MLCLFRPIAVALGAVALLCSAPYTRTAAQTPGGASGTIMDAETSRPLPGAAVTLEPGPVGAFPAARGAEGSFLQSTRTVYTDSTGWYHFRPVPDGKYRLYVQRIGYRPATLDVELRAGSRSSLSIALLVEPVALEPIRASVVANTVGENSYGRIAQEEPTSRGERRLATERLRQRLHLAADARAVTHADVEEGITLGETDLFRALQRLPGVSTRDDFAAELWVRGAPWEQTRISFDGLPLFNPMQALGLFSGVSPDAIGSAFLYPGVQPVSLGGGAAGALDLRSRHGGDEPLQGTGELSLISGRLALDGAAADGRARWMVAGRRTYVDWLTGAIGRLADEPGVRLPYHFADLAARIDYELDGGRTIEASAIGTRNAITDDLPDVLQGNRVAWGNTAGRLTFGTPLWGGTLRQTVGATRSRTEVNTAAPDSALAERFNASALPVFAVGIHQAFLTGAWTTPRNGWSAGYELSITGVSGEVGSLTALDGDTILESDAIAARRVQLAAWAGRRWQVADRLSVDGGLRGEGGTFVQGGGPLRLAPRVTARYQATPELSLSAGVGRNWQYVQDPLAAGRVVAAGFLNGQVWVVAGDSFPAIRADIVTLGAERWIGTNWLASANAYLRTSNGVLMLNPAPGELNADALIADRENGGLFAVGENHARGLELSARKLAGRWTASFGYALSSSEVEANGFRFAAPTDRRHSLDATAALRLGRAWRLGGAFTAASGEPYTRSFEPRSCDGSADPECVEQPNGRIEEPSAQRNLGYQSLDLLGEWTHRFRRWNLATFLQLRNVLGHINRGAYLTSYDRVCVSRIGDECGDYLQQPDEFIPGLPTVPLFGIRISF